MKPLIYPVKYLAKNDNLMKTVGLQQKTMYLHHLINIRSTANHETALPKASVRTAKLHLLTT